METYLILIENVINNLGSSLVYYVSAILAILVVTILFSLLIIFISARKSAQLKSCKKILTHKNELLQLQEAQSKQNSQKLREIIGTLAQDLALQYPEQPAIDSLEESALWDRQQLVLVELTHRLKSNEHQLLSLQRKIRSSKDYINKLEIARMSVFNNLNEASKKIHQLEKCIDITHQNECNANQTVEKLKVSNQTYKMEIDKLQLVRLSVFNDLNKAIKKINQLEVQLKAVRFSDQQDSSAKTLTDVQEQNQILRLEIEQLTQSRVEMSNELNSAREKISQLEKDLKNTEDNPTEIVNDEITTENYQEVVAESLPQAQPFFSKIMNSFKAKQAPTSDLPGVDDTSGITEIIDSNILAERDALIDSLKNELAAQQNHIERLQDRLEAKNTSHQDTIALVEKDVVQKASEIAIDTVAKESDKDPQAVINNMKDQLKTVLQKITIFKKN